MVVIVTLSVFIAFLFRFYRGYTHLVVPVHHNVLLFSLFYYSNGPSTLLCFLFSISSFMSLFYEFFNHPWKSLQRCMLLPIPSLQKPLVRCNFFCSIRSEIFLIRLSCAVRHRAILKGNLLLTRHSRMTSQGPICWMRSAIPRPELGKLKWRPRQLMMKRNI